MDLREGDVVMRHFMRVLAHNEVLLERDLVAVTDLLEPSKAPMVAVEAGDHIAEAVAVDIVHIHLGTAVRTAGVEVEGMADPWLIQGFGLFPPGVFFEDIHSTVAIDVPDTQSVRVVRTITRR